MLKPMFNNDGSISFVNQNGIPPPEIAGYDRDPKDQWRFIPVADSCKHRLIKSRLSDCKRRMIISQYCKLFDKDVNIDICDRCPQTEIAYHIS